MNFAKSIIENTNANIRVHFIKKSRSRGGTHSAVIFPNAIDEKIKAVYRENFSTFTDGKELREYDGVHKETDTIQSVPTSDLDEWTRITAAIDIAEQNNVVLDMTNFGDDYSLIVVTYEAVAYGEIHRVHLVAKYRKTDVWYKKSIKYTVIGGLLKEVDKEIFILNGCIDAVISAESVNILMPKNFEDIFNYYEKSKTLVEESRTSIEAWAFLDDPVKLLDSIQDKKGAILKMARVIQKSLDTLNALTPAIVKSKLIQYEEFNGIEYDEQDRIVVTRKNRDMIINILLNIYAKNLFTDELVHTKGS
jgi:hypothetical protein